MLSFLHKSSILVRVSSYQSILSARTVLSHSFCSSALKDDNSFTVSYLVESCGLSRDSAMTISRYLNLRSADKPDKVLAFLRAHSFTDTQIAKLVKGRAKVLLCTPERSLVPKFDFFYSKGLSKTDLAGITSSQPLLLVRSLKNCIIPLFDFYKSIFQSDEEVVSAIKCCPHVLRGNFKTIVEPRINILESYGIPRSHIGWLLKYHPALLFAEIDNVRDTLKKLQELGFDTESSLFVVAFSVMRKLTKASWDRKISVFKRWGWSEETVLKAFLKQPHCMSASEEKITLVMDYFVNKLGCDSLLLAQNPYIFSYSMERRIIPRTSVIRMLQQKGLLSKEFKWSTPLQLSEENFLQKYIDPYKEKIPELIKLYGKRLDPSVPEYDP